MEQTEGDVSGQTCTACALSMESQVERGVCSFSDLASPEVAPDKTHLRPQEHQRSACYVDIISFCAPPTKFGLQLGAGRPPKSALEPQDSWP